MTVRDPSKRTVQTNTEEVDVKVEVDANKSSETIKEHIYEPPKTRR